jgi:hypothetical protein
LHNHEVLRGVRQKVNTNDITVPLYGIVEISDLNKPELIIDVSNKYNPDESDESIRQMSDTIIGVAETIVKSNEKWRVPIFQTTSYLQYCPPERQPWNRYSEIRNRSLEILRNGTSRTGNILHEFVIHDTYGEVARKKFLDLSISAIQNRKVLAAGHGNSILNLTHISDICNFIAKKVNNENLALSEDIRWNIKSSDTYTLRSLIKLLENISGVEKIVEWGTLENPRREVLELWEISNSRNEFNQETFLQVWAEKKLKNFN